MEVGGDGREEEQVGVHTGRAPAPGRVDPAAAWDGHPLLRRRVADDVAGLQRAVGVLDVPEEEEPVAGVEEGSRSTKGAAELDDDSLAKHPYFFWGRR